MSRHRSAITCKRSTILPGLDGYRKAEKTLPKLQPVTPLELEQGVASERRPPPHVRVSAVALPGEAGQRGRRHREELTAFEQACRIQWPTAPTSCALPPPQETAQPPQRSARWPANGPHLSQSTAGEPGRASRLLMGIGRGAGCFDGRHRGCDKFLPRPNRSFRRRQRPV